MKQKKILLVEDNEVDKLLFREYLRGTSMKDWSLTCVEHLAKGLKAIREQQFEIVVLDLSLPDSQGLDGLVKVKEVNQFIPVLILTGLGEYEMGMKAIQFGAQDYLQKDGLNEHLLEKSLIFSLERARLKKQDQQQTIDQLKETQKELLKNQEELKLALAREKELSEIRSDFISGASHQFRTPLAVIKSNTELLIGQMDSKDPRILRMQTRINREIDRMVSIMDDLLKISEFKTSDYMIKPEKLDIVQLAEQTVAEFNSGLGANGWAIKTEFPQNSINATLDSNLFKEALQSTFSYVFNYQSAKEFPCVRVKELSGSVKLILQQTGLKIPEDQRKHIFEPFFQPDHLPDYHGSALGLYTAKHQIESMDGVMSLFELAVEEVGFEFTFPA